MHILYTPTKCWTSLVGSHHEDLRQDSVSCFHIKPALCGASKRPSTSHVRCRLINAEII